MDKFNEHILLVMQWLQNPTLISKEQLKSNCEAAVNASDAAFDAVADAANAASALEVAHAAYTAADYADYADYAYGHATSAAIASAAISAKHWLSVTKERLNKYFELTEENREAYENKAKHLNILGAKNE